MFIASLSVLLTQLNADSKRAGVLKQEIAVLLVAFHNNIDIERHGLFLWGGCVRRQGESTACISRRIVAEVWSRFTARLSCFFETDHCRLNAPTVMKCKGNTKRSMQQRKAPVLQQTQKEASSSISIPRISFFKRIKESYMVRSLVQSCCIFSFSFCICCSMRSIWVRICSMFCCWMLTL